ncbi:beta-galactosidase GalA [Hydrocarboniphaga sp.]|uniref:beta-galactosidase GalA n=1 Tax=Hydrocarboniphaga sp. TaxID=2033016 RepID=UPI003D0E439B
MLSYIAMLASLYLPRGLLLGLLVVSLPVEVSAAPLPRETLSLDAGWRFHLGDIAPPEIRGHGMSYANAKAGRAWGAAAPQYDDTQWRQLDLPHDWAVEGPFDPKANVSQGYRPRGVGWYRRNFRLDAADRGRHIELQFDGIATHATVWFNGSLVQRNFSGYNSFYIDLTPMAKYGGEQNTIAVRVDAEPMEGWWYEGAGIYRHAWLVKRAPLHIVTDGVYAQPRRDEDGRWRVPVEVTLANAGKAAAQAEIEAELLDAQGKTVASVRGAANVGLFDQAAAKLEFAVDAPRLWTLEDPALYQLRTRVRQAGAVIDENTVDVGFRYFHFDADRGFFFNGRPLKLKGVCLHQDHAGVGVAVPDSLWEFRLRELKALGVNAIRSAHNAPAKEMLDAADRLGLLVMDENRNFNTSDDTMRQLEWLVRRDRSRASVFLWSVFNEEPVQGTEIGYEMVRRMGAAVKRLDVTRPVTAAMNDGVFATANVSQAVDVVGFNYQQNEYDRFHAANPKLPMFSSEDTSSFMTRGAYQTDLDKHVMNSYDEEPSSWGATHRAAWKAIAERPFVAGTFVWTGFDYRGEPTPFTWPSAGSFFGMLDLAGFPKAAAWLHQAQWIDDRPILQLLPHWNWAGREGQPIKVMVMTNAERVELRLNGRLVSEQAVDRYTMPNWQVPYAPGRLEALAKRDGEVIARQIVETTGEPVRLQLLPDRRTLAGDGRDALPVTVQALDARGRPVPTANLGVEFSIDNGRIIGLGNGDPNSHEPEKGTLRSLFNGLAQVIVQSQPGGHGALRLSASAPGLRAAKLKIGVAAVSPPPAVPAGNAQLVLEGWRGSPFSASRPDPHVRLLDNDMNSWAWLGVGRIETDDKASWRQQRVRFTPYAETQKSGDWLRFEQLSGKAEIWLDDKLLGRKDDAGAREFSLRLPPGQGERELSVLIETSPGTASGFVSAMVDSQGAEN